MPEPLVRPIGATRVGHKGQITVPTNYRNLHNLSKGSEVLLIQLGEALMVLPADLTMNHLCQRIQETLAGENVSVERALKKLEKVRRRRFESLYGKG